MATKAHSQVYNDENTHAKRGKTSHILPTATRTAFADVSNVVRATSVQGGVVKKPSTATTFPSVHRASVEAVPALQQQQQQQQASLATSVDPMDTTLEDIADLSINAPSTSSVSPIVQLSAAGFNQYDEADKLDAQTCAEYGAEIQQYWRQTELRRAPSATYMSRQTEINAKMREILVDWMVEVQLKFRLKEETLFLSIHLLDRFLERRLVGRTKLQLVGCTALLLAAKYEEIYSPEVADFVAISDKAYSREQILAMEGIMLTALNFNLTVPLPINFLQRYARLCSIEQGDQVWQLTMYFAQLTLPAYAFLSFAPSTIAAAALYLSMSTAKQAMGLGHEPVWTAEQSALMDYTVPQVRDAVHALYALVEAQQNGTAKYKAVKKKFALDKFLAVAKYTCKPPTC